MPEEKPTSIKVMPKTRDRLAEYGKRVKLLIKSSIAFSMKSRAGGKNQLLKRVIYYSRYLLPLKNRYIHKGLFALPDDVHEVLKLVPRKLDI